SAAAGNRAGAPTPEGGAAVLVGAAAAGYPAPPRTGDRIDGIDSARGVAGGSVYCSGVTVDESGALVTAGGRVLNVIGRGTDVLSARAAAYETLGHLRWPGLHHRTDIAGEITS
ncbi:MAG: phosphoribosylglycinamide synthetase C domain-containing protein, partial [Microthrixaceae bacterium]